MKSFYCFFVPCMLISTIESSFVIEGETSHVNASGESHDLATMVSQLTNLLVEQQKSMAEFHMKVLSKLDEQTEKISLLSKKSKSSKQQPNSPKPALKTGSTSTVSSTSSSSPTSSSTPTASATPPSKSLIPSAWTYPADPTGPQTWPVAHPGCGKENQSPVDLQTLVVALRKHKSPISFSYNNVNTNTCKLVNTGNTATILLINTPTPQPSLSGGPLNTTEYYFTEAVFHWGTADNQGSEHTIRATTYPLEMQLVHHTSEKGDKKLAVASFLFEVSQDDNPVLAPIITALSSIKDAGSEVEIETVVDDSTNENDIQSFSMDDLIQDSSSGPYFTYSGSLTYPPCTEVKQYMVFRTPIDISSKQLEQFRLLQQQDGTRMVDNFRPVQAMGERLLAFTM